MFKFATGLAVGFLLKSQLGDASMGDMLQLAQSMLADERVGELVRTGAAAAGDAIRTLGVALTEEGQARSALGGEADTA